MVRVITTDLDGTLLKPKKKFSLVEKENKKFIKEFYGDIVLCSGRNAKFCAKICNKLKIEHNFIALNGAIIVKNGNVIYSQSIKKTNLISLFNCLKDNYNNYEFLIFDKYDKITSYSTLKKSKAKLKNFKQHLKNGRLHNKIKVSNKTTEKYLNDKTPIYKALIYSEKAEAIGNFLFSKYNEHFEFFISDHSIEISPKGVNKGKALKHLISTTNVKDDEVFVVGDGINDLSLFENFENSFLVTNEKNHLKIKTKYKIEKFSDLKKHTQLNKNFQ